jgi:hypothetical protein
LIIHPDNLFTSVCKPYAEIPAWWSGFLFHVLNTRQLSLYLYLAMLSGETGVCHPTTQQIRQDLGLASVTIVFEAIAVLEELGFILRQRRNIEELQSRRNIYQRPSCEYTIWRLLHAGKIDGALRPTPGSANPMSLDSQRLKDEWLQTNLESEEASYGAGDANHKTAVLMNALARRLGALVGATSAKGQISTDDHDER